MRTKIILSVIFLFCALFFCHAQSFNDIELRTPKGTTIYGQVYLDSRSEHERKIVTDTDSAIIKYSDVVVLELATKAYNCVAYAFVMAEGGPVCSLDYPSTTAQYWIDGSYIVTDSTNAEIIRYQKNKKGNNDEHFAVKDPIHPGMYISKWGDTGPLVRHLPNDCDYDVNFRTYYKKNPNTHLITGDHFVCDGGSSFTYNNYFVGSKVWDIVATGTSTPSNAYFSISGSNTGSTVTVYKTGNGIYVKNVTVSNGAKLTFKTTGSVIFGASFVVEPGSDFEIQNK